MALQEPSAAADTPASELLQAQARIFRDRLAHAGSMSIVCAIDLGIPCVIHDHGRPMTLSELVSELSLPESNSPALLRIMRLLVHKGYFAYDKESDTYSLTSLSKLLVNDSPTSLSSWFLGITQEDIMSPWRLLAPFCRLDHEKHYTTACEMRLGKPFWELTNEIPEVGEMFNMTMASDSRVVVKAMTSQCSEAFQGLKSLVDVGGGDGTMAMGIAEAFPQVKCILFDQPRVIDELPKSRLVEAVGGDMFKKIPSADAVFMKLILHNWSDEDCVKILKRCKEAISSAKDGGKVMIVDIVLDPNNQDVAAIETQLCYDITMLTFHEGKEREEKEWKKIFENAGFKSYKITPLGIRSLIEVFP